MSRALSAPISQNEESVLRRINAGINGASALPLRDVERLKRLELVEQRGHRLMLTRPGLARVASLLQETASR